jgi:hypothetical protein
MKFIYKVLIFIDLNLKTFYSGLPIYTQIPFYDFPSEHFHNINILTSKTLPNIICIQQQCEY